MQIPKFVDSEHALHKIIRIATNCHISVLDWSCADHDTGDQLLLYKIRVALFRNSNVLNHRVSGLYPIVHAIKRSNKLG